MAIYDAGIDKVVVRIVYDGPGTAGKTTNLRSLAGLYAPSQRSELTSPEEKVGRTTFFDWLHLDGGLAAGRALRAELVTVPGQRVLARRRFALLDGADAIVFVVDCQPAQLAESRQMFASLRAHLERTGRDRTVALVVQANKRDLADAVSLDRVREELLIEPHLPILEAQATSDVGVRETLVFALRGASRAVSERVAAHGWSELHGSAGRPEDLKARIVEFEQKNPLSPVALLLGDWTATALDDPSTVAPPPSTTTTSASESSAASSPPSTSRRPPSLHPRDDDWPLPSPDVESGWIWPATSGRDALRRIPFERAKRVVDASGPTGVAFLAGDHLSLSHERRRFDDVESARQSLVALAREKSQLGPLLPDGLVLSLTAHRDGSVVLWSTTRKFESLPSAVERALRSGALDEAREFMRRCAQAVVQAAILMLRGGVVLDLDLEHFALEGDHIRYFGDGAGSPEDVPHWASLWLEGIEPWSGEAELVEAWIEELERRLATDLDASELRQLNLQESLAAASLPTELEPSRARLLRALGAQ